MEIRYPEYYKKFRCIAGDCPDTCCAGWEIAVDPASEKRYKEAAKTVKNREFAKKLKKHMKNGLIISEDVMCPFLNQDRLCEMYIELGPESLCHTCKRHPRHMEDYGNLHEMVLLLSCPEVARLVLEENSGGFYVRNLPDRQGHMDGIDEELLELLLQIRELIWNIGKNQRISIENRMVFALAMAHDVQRRLIKNDYQGMFEILKRYQKEGAVDRFLTEWQGKQKKEVGDVVSDYVERFFLMSDFMEAFSKLEPIRCDWPKMLEETRSKLYHSKDSRACYLGKMGDFLRKSQGLNEDFEKLFGYFIYSFFLTSLYDGDVLTKVKMAVLCTEAIEELYLKAEVQTPDMRVEICHALARQIENSNENREELEQILKQKTFGTRRIIDALFSNMQMEVDEARINPI